MRKTVRGPELCNHDDRLLLMSAVSVDKTILARDKNRTYH